MDFISANISLPALMSVFLATAATALPTEKDSRLHADAPRGWGVQLAPGKDPNLPRVLLIGDSILNGHLSAVTRELEGKANVDAWVNPHHQASQGLHEKLRDILAGQKYDVIHFNMGLHGWPEGRIPDGEFIPLTRKLVETLRAGAPKARLIWASSTPVTIKGQPTALDPAINPTIVDHNAMAAQVMAAAKVPVNDLYALMAKRLDLTRGDQLHWKPEGSALQGKAVAKNIAEQLNGPAPAAGDRPTTQAIQGEPDIEASPNIAAR
jgi:hypothetical protein